jgi:hypothetical protein
MRLSRVTEHIHAQNWTAVGLDLVIVVVGVFIGMQVSNWNARLADERLGRAYASRLVADLERDRGSHQAMVDYYGEVLASVERTDQLLADPRSSPRELLVAAYRASEVIYSPPTRATWDEIVSSGDTGLLPRQGVAPVADYFAYDTQRDAYEYLAESAYRLRVRSIIPLGVQKALRAGCSDARDGAQQIRGFMAQCRLDVPPETIAATAAALRADPEVQRSLRFQYSDVVSAHMNIQGVVAQIGSALAGLRRRSSPGAQAP